MSSLVNGNDVCCTIEVTKAIYRPQIVVLAEASWVRKENHSPGYATILMKVSYCPSHNEWFKMINLDGWCPQETELTDFCFRKLGTQQQ